MLNTKLIKKLLLITVLASVIGGCTTKNDEIERVPDRSPKARYQEAKTALNDELYNKAITILSDLETRYPFGPLSRQVQLDLMFAYYKSGKFVEAIPAIDRFISLNPNNSNLDYVYYMRGLVNMESGINSFQEFFGVEGADKDITATRDAFEDFKTLIKKYPDSKYIADAKARMTILLDKLAKYELIIAEYYMRRAAYVAAINRCKYILEYYQDSDMVKPALEIMVDAYDKLGLEELKADTAAVLAANS